MLDRVAFLTLLKVAVFPFVTRKIDAKSKIYTSMELETENRRSLTARLADDIELCIYSDDFIADKHYFWARYISKKQALFEPQQMPHWKSLNDGLVDAYVETVNYLSAMGIKNVISYANLGNNIFDNSPSLA